MFRKGEVAIQHFVLLTANGLGSDSKNSGYCKKYVISKITRTRFVSDNYFSQENVKCNVKKISVFFVCIKSVFCIFLIAGIM